MFEAPLDAQVSYSALHDVLRDPARNFLFDHAGAAEDEQGIVIRPDCADLPYFLRAYFAYKLGLPFGWSRCSRGENGMPPTCTDFATSSDPVPAASTASRRRCRRGPIPQRAAAARGTATRSASASSFARRWPTRCSRARGARPPTTTTSDYYPVALSAETLRPGTIFADPYGHVLVVAAAHRRRRRPPEASCSPSTASPTAPSAASDSGEGTSSSPIDPALGSAGFKRFRPVVRDAATRQAAAPEERRAPRLLGVGPVRGRRRGLLRQDGRRPLAVAARSDDGAPRDGRRRSRSR